MRVKSVAGIVVGVLLASTAVIRIPAAAEGVRVQSTVATGLTTPWGIAFLPDGDALVSERDTARIKRVSPSGQVTTVGRVRGVVAQGEGGLLGLALPTGTMPTSLFAYLTTATDNRVVRIAWDGEHLGRQVPILTGIPKNTFHNGGRLLTGPDNTLFIGTGDAGTPSLAQDRTSLAGKILHVTQAGRPASGNPRMSSPVYSWGHRNVQGLAFDERGRLWATEFGEHKADELNLIRSGRNYGWPLYEGSGASKGFVDPFAQWSPTSLASPSGLAIMGGTAYVASLRGEVLWQVPLVGEQAGRSTAAVIGRYGRLRTIAQATDGSLWLLTSNTDGRGDPRPTDDRILRLTIA